MTKDLERREKGYYWQCCPWFTIIMIIVILIMKVMIVTTIEHLIGTRHSTKCFIFVFSFCPQYGPMRILQWLFTFYGGNRGLYISHYLLKSHSWKWMEPGFEFSSLSLNSASLTTLLLCYFLKCREFHSYFTAEETGSGRYSTQSPIDRKW